MKSSKRTKINLLLTILILSAIQVGFIPSDSCTSYYPMEKGRQFELTYYNSKGKAGGRTEYEIIDKQELTNGLISTVHMKNYDKKDKLVMENDYEVKCENGVFEIDIRGFLSGAQMEQMQSLEGMDVTVKTENLQLPSTMKAGDQLKDGKLEMELNSTGGGMTLVSFNTYIKNRKVVGKESVTTSAGTFDCLLITSEVSTKSGFIKMNWESKEWISENVGVVRSETYKKGKLDSYTELTKLN